MGRKKIAKIIRTLIENCTECHHRAMFLILGKKSRYQVVFFYHLLSKSYTSTRPSVLWCFKKELGFSMHNNKRIRELKKLYQAENISMTDEALFDQFIIASNLQYCHFSETDKILGQTFGMIVIQDFEGLTPNVLARIIETVEGGGVIVFLIPNVTSLDELTTLKMHVHDHYTTENHPVASLRFNSRFVHSLHSCGNCLVLDDELRAVLSPFKIQTPNSISFQAMAEPQSSKQNELLDLKQSQADIKYMKNIIDQCCTADQAKALLQFFNSLLNRKTHSVTVLTSARGRGKSSTLGLSVALAVALKYSTIFLTSPHVENLKTLFTFLIKGLDLLRYKDGTDYIVSHSTNEQGVKYVSCIEFFKSHHQIVKYVPPTDASKLSNADLIVIDEAAAIPLSFVKSWIGPFKIFMASTINGYEGTGRSLSLKLINYLQKQSVAISRNEQRNSYSTPFTGHSLCEVTLNQPIRYADNDAIEAWLNKLLCLDAAVVPSTLGAPPDPQQCQLYYVNLDILFSYRKAAEIFLQNTVALFVSSHYKNSPNDLQMMADAPAHHVFCLLPPIGDARALPEILCVIQVALEGKLSKSVIIHEKSRGQRASGDLIPWIISQQFLDDDFPCYAGARIVRIATHPEYQKRGYGLRALQILFNYYKGTFSNVTERLSTMDSTVTEVSLKKVSYSKETNAKSHSALPHLLLGLDEREPEILDYIGVSYGLTFELLRFWKKANFVPLYIRQTQNELTAEHSCVMVKELSGKIAITQCLSDYWLDFSERFASLLGSSFSNMPANLAFDVSSNKIAIRASKELTSEEMNLFISQRSKKRLEMYCQHLIDYHLILDLMPVLSRMYFLHRLKNISFPYIQSVILLCLGLQNKSVEDTAKELNMQITEVMGLLSQIVKKILHSLNYNASNISRKSGGKDKSWKSFSPRQNSTNSKHNSLQTNLSDVHKSSKSPKSIKRQMNSSMESVQHRKKSKFQKSSKVTEILNL